MIRIPTSLRYAMIRRTAVLPVLLAAMLAAAGPVAAQTTAVVERTNVQTAPSHFTSAVTVTLGGPPQIVRLGERGLTRDIFFDDAKLTAWAEATYNARAVIYLQPDIPESND